MSRYPIPLARSVSPMPNSIRTILHPAVPTLFLIFLVMASCGGDIPGPDKKNEVSRLSGTWTLKSRMTDGGGEAPAAERCMRLELHRDGTFNAKYRGTTSQPWIKAGQGAFSYAPPYLDLYWESGAKISLLVTELDQDRILVHHGRNLAPLKDQEPEELFTRERIEKGPTRSPS